MKLDVTKGLPSRIHNVLDEGAQSGKGRIAFVDETGKKWSFAETIAAVDDAAKELVRLGVRPGDRVMLVCENAIASIVLLYAITKIDAITAVINARQSAREVDAIIDDCSPRRVIFSDIVSDKAKEHADRHQASPHAFGAVGPMMVSPLSETCEPIQTFEDPAKQVAILIYTTGTTGRPKGVMLSHQNLLFVAARSKRTGKLSSADVGMCLMPIAHSYGFSTMQGHIFAGSRLHIMPRFSEEKVFELITSGTLTVFIAVPALYNRLVDTCQKHGRTLLPNSLRFMLTGTAPLDKNLRMTAEELFGAVMENGYGLTETSPTISRSSYAYGTDDVNLGAPIEGVEVKLLDNSGNEVANGEAGELWVRGPNVMLGYFGNPEATAAIFDEDGFMNTGDVVRQDENGVMTIEGRTKELIIRSGFNVYPVEVEAQLNSHPDVLGSAVIGCETGSDETIVAFIEAVPNAQINKDELLAHARERLTAYKVPSHIFVVDALPYSPNAKILKKQLKEQAEEILAQS